MCLLPHVALIAAEGPSVRVQGPFVPGPHQEVEGACVRRGGSEGPLTFPHSPPSTPYQGAKHWPHQMGPSPHGRLVSILLTQRGPQSGKERRQQQGSIHQDNLQSFFHVFPSFLISNSPHPGTHPHPSSSRQESCPRILGPKSEHKARFPKHIVHTLGDTRCYCNDFWK